MRRSVASSYGLSWNPNKQGYLLSGSDDFVRFPICVADNHILRRPFACGMWSRAAPAYAHRTHTCMPQPLQPGNTMQAQSIFNVHTDIVEASAAKSARRTHPAQDVQWHMLHDSIFGSVGDDRKLMMYGRPANRAVPNSRAAGTSAPATARRDRVLRRTGRRFVARTVKPCCNSGAGELPVLQPVQRVHPGHGLGGHGKSPVACRPGVMGCRLWRCGTCATSRRGCTRLSRTRTRFSRPATILRLAPLKSGAGAVVAAL